MGCTFIKDYGSDEDFTCKTVKVFDDLHHSENKKYRYLEPKCEKRFVENRRDVFMVEICLDNWNIEHIRLWATVSTRGILFGLIKRTFRVWLFSGEKNKTLIK